MNPTYRDWKQGEALLGEVEDSLDDFRDWMRRMRAASEPHEPEPVRPKPPDPAPDEPANDHLVTTLNVGGMTLPGLAWGVVPVRVTGDQPWVTHEGFAVQREPVTYDANGDVDSWLVHAPVTAWDEDYADWLVPIYSIGEEGVRNWGRIPGEIDRELVLRMDGERDRVVSADYFEETGPWVYNAKYFGPLGPLGVHWYIARRADGLVEVNLRVNNGTVGADGSGASGAVYFRRMTIEVPDGWSLVPEVERAGEWSHGPREYVLAGGDNPPNPHVIPPRAQFERRFILCKPGLVEQAKRVLAMDGWGRAEGPASFFHGGWGVRYERVPDWSKVNPLWQGIDNRARTERGAHESMLRNDATLGLFNPSGHPIAYAHGGSGIHTCDPFLSREWMRYWRLAHMRNLERMPIAAFRDEDGEPLTDELVAEAHGGVFPYEIHHTSGYKHSLPWWDDAAPVGEGPCEYEDELRRWEPHDTEHAVRAFVPARVLAFGCGDRMAMDDLRMMGAHWSHEWTTKRPAHIPAAITPNGWWRNSSLYARTVTAKPGNGTGSGRDVAWVGELILTLNRLHAGNHDDYALSLVQWLTDFADWLARISMPNGLLQRRRHPTYFSPDPHTQGVPRSNDASQVLEAALLAITCAGLERNGFERRAMHRIVQEGWEAVEYANDGKFPPKKWMVFGGEAAAYAHGPKDGSGREGSQSQHWRYLAGNWEGDEAWVREVVKRHLQGEGKLWHAGSGVAGVVNV